MTNNTNNSHVPAGSSGRQAAPRPARRLQTAPRRRRGPGGGIALLALIGALVVALGILFQYVIYPDGFRLKTDTAAQETVAEIHASTTVQLNEVMSANKSVLRGADDETPDWIEICNAGSETVNLRGWSLAKVANSTSAFTFPEHELAPGECVLIFADSQLRNTYGYDYHAPFSIRASGDTLMLFNAKGTAVDTVNIPELRKNSVYRQVDGVWEVSTEYTPGMENTYENYVSLIEIKTASDVVINEIMASNATCLPAEDGQYYDYIELYNQSADAVDLSGWYLSDGREENTEWRIPDGTVISGHGYLVFYASGLDEGLHTNFKLASEGEEAVLCNAQGQLLDIVSYELLKSDQAYSRQSDGSFTKNLAPTPGMANTTESAALTESQFAARNTMGVYFSEVMASTNQQEYDWVEIVNRSQQAVDISGCGLSDDPAGPRKWQFPEGTVLQPGQYLGVFLSGISGQTASGVLYADFKVSAEGGDTLTLSTPAGEVFDRMFLPEQIGNVSYGRIDNRSGFYYLETATPGAENVQTGYQGRAGAVEVSVSGGLYQTGDTLTVELLCEPESRIYYTLDATEPTRESTPYTGPLSVGETTVLRMRAYRDGCLPSAIGTETYFFGVEHDMRVVSLVCEPGDLFDETTGLYMRGPNAESVSPYKGANFWSDAEIEGHVEMFSRDGEAILSQGCGVRLHGQYSRAENQKAFKIIARSQYGDNRFRARIFDNRDYAEYQSFLLRGSGQDGQMTRMRDSVLQTLAENTSVMYMETELCVVYINGQYWGHYNIRERVNKYSICQFEGWEGQEDGINLVKANTNVLQGSDETYQTMLSWVKKNGVPDDAALEAVGQVIDLQNYIEYHALEIFVGNGDTANVKRYMNPNADGKWRYVLFDLDWAFYTDTDSIARWLAPGGMGTNKGTDNALFIALMKNATFRDRFLTYMGEMMATDWSTEVVLAKFQARYVQLQSEMPRQMQQWGQSQKNYAAHLERLYAYCQTRPTKLLYYFQDALDLTNEQMQHYFGDAIAQIAASTN